MNDNTAQFSTILKTDVVIIGAGPVGLFSIFQCGMLGLKTHVIDALDMIGGQCAALYPEKPIYDIPAAPHVLAGDLIERLIAQAKPFAPHYHLGQQVSGFTRKGAEIFLNTDKGLTFVCRSVIIAAGAGAFGPNRPPLENLAAFENRSVFYHVRDMVRFKGKRIVIAGGGDSAVDWALALADIAHVEMVHRRDHFRAAPASLARLMSARGAGLITLHAPYQLHRLHGHDGQLSHVSIAHADGSIRDVPCDVLLPFFGLSASLGPLAGWGLEGPKGAITTNPLTGETSLSDFYAVGDVATYPHKLKLILTGFAEAAQTAHAIRAKLYPDQAFHMEYSTTRGIPVS